MGRLLVSVVGVAAGGAELDDLGTVVADLDALCPAYVDGVLAGPAAGLVEQFQQVLRSADHGIVGVCAALV